MNFVNGGGSSQLPTLEDVVMYDNRFAQGATQTNYTNFTSLNSEDQNSKFAIGSAINAIGFSQGLPGFSDYSGGANGCTPSKHKESDLPGIGMRSVMYAFAESGVYGDMDKVRNISMWEALVHMYHLTKKSKDYEANQPA